jgi:SMODS and SLOG-associating 2TM effector domain 2
MQYEAAWQELRQRAGAGRAVAGKMLREPAAALVSSTTASADDNVVALPARHDLHPSHGDAAPAAAAVEWTALEPLVKEVIANASATHAWYDKRASHVKNLSRITRLCAIWLGVLGGLCPLLPDSFLLTPFLPYFEDSRTTATGSGLVFFVIAGGCLLLDQAFGFSTSWMRYRLAELRLGKLIRTFAVEVDSELAKCGGKRLPADRADIILARLKAFVAEVENRKIEETETWVSEFKAGLLQIEQFTKTRGNPRADEITGNKGVANRCNPLGPAA